MALLHQAQLHPSKLELLSEWVSTRDWFVGDADAEFINVAAYRFDDPKGEVGVETILVRAGDGPTFQVPLTYRGAPLEGAESSLIGTMEHSVLGKRWVYDAVGDPVYLQTVATAALNGGHQAELVVATDAGRVVREPNAVVSGSGNSIATVELPSVHDIVVTQEGGLTDVVSGPLHLRVLRVIASPESTDDLGVSPANSDSTLHTGTLNGTWTESPHERKLVAASLTSE